LLVLDTSGLLSAIDSAQTHHPPCAAAVRADPGPLLLSPFVLGEMDYLLGQRVGIGAELSFLGEVAAGAYQLEPFDREDVADAMKLIDKYGNLEIGLADASIAVIAARWKTNRLLTLDHRHFRAVRPLGGGRSFKLLPADSP